MGGQFWTLNPRPDPRPRFQTLGFEPQALYSKNAFFGCQTLHHPIEIGAREVRVRGHEDDVEDDDDQRHSPKFCGAHAKFPSQSHALAQKPDKFGYHALGKQHKKQTNHH